MALEDIVPPKTGVYIGDLDSANPDGSTDKVKSLDDHIRGVKNVLLLSFPGITGPVTVTHTELNDLATKSGAETITGEKVFTANVFLGDATPSLDDSALLIGRGLSISYVTGYHAIRDETTYTASGVAFHAYASFDSIPTFKGAEHYNHLHCYQARPSYNGSNLIDAVTGFPFQFTHSGTGAVTNLYGLKFDDSLVTGGGTIDLQAALYVGSLVGATANYCIYSSSVSVPSYHAGFLQLGTPPRIDVAAFKTTYGQLLSVNSSGDILSNAGLKIVSGTLTFDAAAAIIKSTTAFSLKLDSVGTIESLKPHKFPVFAVASLPVAASYTYCRAFASDANTTLALGIGTTVVTGGANKVPVFSDGTNWIIG